MKKALVFLQLPFEMGTTLIREFADSRKGDFPLYRAIFSLFTWFWGIRVGFQLQNQSFSNKIGGALIALAVLYRCYVWWDGFLPVNRIEKVLSRGVLLFLHFIAAVLLSLLGLGIKNILL